MTFLRRTCTVLMILGGLASTGQSQSLQQTTSLQFVPAKAAFYSVMLQNREAFERFVHSRAFAKLHEMPVVQQGLAHLRSEWETGDLGQVREFLAAPENQELVKVLADAVSNEVFFYGDARHGKWIGTLGRMGNSLNLAQMQAAQRGDDPEEAAQQAILNIIDQNPDLLRVPSTVIGFRISDAAAVTKQIDRLEMLLNHLIANEAPQLEGRLSRQAFGEGKFLTLKLDGSLVPWNDVFEDSDLDADVQEQLEQKLSKVTLNINLGIHKNYLILALGEDDSQLQGLGTGDLLKDHAKIQPLVKYFDRDVTGVGYASEEFMQEVSGVEERMNQMRDLFKAMIEGVPIGEDIKEDLNTDADLFFQQVIDLQPRIGAVSGVSYRVPNGVESLSYNWTERKNLDGSQPLTILDHVGGDPIGFVAARSKESPADVEFMSRWSVKLGSYVERIAEPFLDSDQEELYEAVKKLMLPLGQRLAVASRDQFSPAFADGQVAMVFDAQTSKKQWHMAMPAAEEPVALPELALVWTVADAEKVKVGGQEYLDVVRAAVAGLSEIMPERIPPIEVPGPETRELPNGQLFYYAVPPFLGLDPAIAPNAGLSKDHFVLSLAPAATERLLNTATFNRQAVLAGTEDRPLAFAWQFKVNRLVDLARPWVAYGLQVAKAEGTEDPEVAAQIHTVLDVLSCLRTCNGIGYVEGDATVSYSRLEYQDLPQ